MSWSGYYDEFADRYDAYTAEHDWQPNQLLTQVLDRLGVTPMSVLDLGAGTGQTATALRERWPDATLRLVEPSRGMAVRAAARHPDADLVVRDADAHLADDEETYDLVTAIGVLELVPSLAATLSAAAARLAPGGHLAVTHEPLEPTSSVQSNPESVLDEVLDRRVRRRERDQVEAVAAAAGLTRVAGHDLVAYRRGTLQDDVVYELVVWQAAY